LIAVDASSLIAYFQGEIAPDTDRIADALGTRELVLPPPVLVELIGRVTTAAAFDEIANGAAQLPIGPGFWLRARQNRSLILSKGLKARALDSLIAQCCIDANVPLIARDADYRHFSRWCGLKLAP
jgi:predicted nucleic acid-binding protein